MPVINGLPFNIIQKADANSTTAAVSWTPPAATDNSGVVSMTSTHNPGDLFSNGTTTVMYVAMDPYANKATVSFTVTVAGKY